MWPSGQGEWFLTARSWVRIPPCPLSTNDSEQQRLQGFEAERARAAAANMFDRGSNPIMPVLSLQSITRMIDPHSLTPFARGSPIMPVMCERKRALAE